MPLKGTKARTGNSPFTRTSHVRSFLHGEGGEGAWVHECVILDVNLKTFTVDCFSKFDQLRFLDIQVASPYLHPNAGEGFTAVPEVGSKCYVCIPSDSSPPFVLAFLMPMESMDASSEDDEETSSTDASFAGGRVRPKPGDIYMKGRDGNFVVLHRGGILQIGCGPLAQRLYVPLTNLITDVSQNYNHFNTGGSINWGVRDVSNNPETEFKQTFRVYANDEFADVRVSVGKVQIPVLEPAGEAGSTNDMAALDLNDDKTIVLEFALAPGGFDTTAGLPNTASRNATKLRFFYTKAGGVMFRSEASVSLRVKKKLRLRVDDTIEIFGKKSINIEADTTMKLSAKKLLELSTDGGVVRINGGNKPVATVGSIVRVTLIAPVAITVGGAPGTISAGAIMDGTVTTGNPSILC